jgi:hypothetical protein
MATVVIGHTPVPRQRQSVGKQLNHHNFPIDFIISLQCINASGEHHLAIRVFATIPGATGRLNHTTGWQNTPQQRPDTERQKWKKIGKD